MKIDPIFLSYCLIFTFSPFQGTVNKHVRPFVCIERHGESTSSSCIIPIATAPSEYVWGLGLQIEPHPPNTPFSEKFHNIYNPMCMENQSGSQTRTLCMIQLLYSPMRNTDDEEIYDISETYSDSTHDYKIKVIVVKLAIICSIIEKALKKT